MQGFVLVVALTLASMPMMVSSTSDIAMGDIGKSEACVEPLSKKEESALLQMSTRSQKVSTNATQHFDANKTHVNPSGAAAPLDEVGYSAVADRCCQAEMKQFIERTAFQLGFDACIHGGLTGLVGFHSCEYGVQTFAKLESDILQDSIERCTWLGAIGNCLPRPEDCPDFPDAPEKPDCGCSRADAAKIDFTSTTVTENNLGGQGPDAGAKEIRYSRIGTTKSGVTFDVVVTAVGPYQRVLGDNNGIKGEFGAINIAGSRDSTGYSGTSEFKFSFMTPGTNTPVVVEEVHMALFDLDMEGVNVAEFTSSKGYRGYVTDVTPSIVASRLDDGRTKFAASIANLPNPTTPNALTIQQRRNSVMYFYRGVSSFELAFGTEGSQLHYTGRNLFFAFESSLNDRCGP